VRSLHEFRAYRGVARRKGWARRPRRRARLPGVVERSLTTGDPWRWMDRRTDREKPLCGRSKSGLARS